MGTCQMSWADNALQRKICILAMSASSPLSPNKTFKNKQK